MLRTQRAMVELLKLVEPSVPTARIGNTAADPVLWLPAPTGYAVWITMRGRDYHAVISRRTEPKEVRSERVGRWGDGPERVWQRAGAWLTDDWELSSAWVRHRAAAVAANPSPPREVPAAPSPAPPPATPLRGPTGATTPMTEGTHPERLAEPLGFDSERIMFAPLGEQDLLTMRVQMSSAAADLIEAAVSSGRFDERSIIEAGALMYIAHMTGEINILGPEGAEYVRTMADKLQVGFDRDAMLATIVSLAERSGLAEQAIELLNTALPPNE